MRKKLSKIYSEEQIEQLSEKMIKTLKSSPSKKTFNRIFNNASNVIEEAKRNFDIILDLKHNEKKQTMLDQCSHTIDVMEETQSELNRLNMTLD
jgi:ferritin-like metal-binding protein YciE